MGIFTVTGPDGVAYQTEADNPEEAHKFVLDHVAKENVPVTTKIRQTLEDPLNQVVHGMTAGWFDKGFDLLTGAKTQEETAKGAARIGPVATGITRATGAMMLPSAAPKAVAAIGGGPLAKTLVGGTVGGVEGAAYGGAEAAAEDRPVLPGVLAGGAGGALGQTTAQALASGANAATKAIKGVVDVPPVKQSYTMPKSPVAKDYVEAAATKAAAVGAQKGALAEQAAQKREINKLLSGPNSSKFTPTQRELMSKVVEPSWGEQGASTMGKILSDKLLASGLGVAGGFGGASPVTGMLSAGASMGAGHMLRRDAAAATQEALDNLRRTMQRKPRFMGPVGPRTARKIGQGLGYDAYDVLSDYIE